MRFWQVTPLSRPHCAEAVIEQFKAQKYADKRLCLVLNGEHLDVLKRLKLSANLILTSEPGKAAALNAAVDALRHQDNAILVRDDDDIYLRGGMQEFVDLLPKYDVVGQLRHWVKDGPRLWYFNQGKHSREGSPKMWGGNIAFRAKDALEFKHVVPGQVHEWATRMKESGASIWHKSPDHACLVRHRSGHSWEAGMEMVRRCSMGDALLFERYDERLVSGELSLERGTVIARPSDEEASDAELARMTAEPLDLAEIKRKLEVAS